ncbi:MAG TPA: hypothetical protein VGR97_06560 [Candidatus Acidoferrales bacterium]|nr:hypothetical protein [Candidatus Acidoferrales bacterium]
MSTNKSQFDSAHLLPETVVGPELTPHAPAGRFKRHPEQILVEQPLAYLNVQVDGRETSYFEWLGAGIYSADWRGVAQNDGPHVLHELRYGFSERFFYLRVDTFPGSWSELRNLEFRIALRGGAELRLFVAIEEGHFAGCLLDTEELCILGPHELVEVAFDKILEVAIGRRLLTLAGQPSLALQVALWQGSLQLELLPRKFPLEVNLGVEAFAWPAQ